MIYVQKQRALSNFVKRMDLIMNKMDSAIAGCPNHDYRAIEYEFGQLKKDYQRFAVGYQNHDQAVFQLGRLIQRFEKVFNKNNPLQYI